MSKCFNKDDVLSDDAASEVKSESAELDHFIESAAADNGGSTTPNKDVFSASKSQVPASSTPSAEKTSKAPKEPGPSFGNTLDDAPPKVVVTESMYATVNKPTLPSGFHHTSRKEQAGPEVHAFLLNVTSKFEWLLMHVLM